MKWMAIWTSPYPPNPEMREIFVKATEKLIKKIDREINDEFNRKIKEESRIALNEYLSR